MRRQSTVTTSPDEKIIGMKAHVKVKLGLGVGIIGALLLMFGYGDGFSPSALTYS